MTKRDEKVMMQIFLKFILGNSGDNNEKHLFAQERSFHNVLRYNQKTNGFHYKYLLTL